MPRPLFLSEKGVRMGRMPWKRFIWDIAIVLAGLLVLFGLRWLVHGSYEWVPTAEQQDKARIGAALYLILTVPVLVWCIFMRLQQKK